MRLPPQLTGETPAWPQGYWTFEEVASPTEGPIAPLTAVWYRLSP